MSEVFKITDWFDGHVIAQCEAETLKEALEKLVADGASLDGASLDGASLVGASLVGARLDGASLVGASLEFIKHDLWGVLLHAQHEVAGLKLALQDGRVDGSCYEGECACLVGTIANVRGCNYRAVDGIPADSTRPAEIWFMGISRGDTAEKNQIVKITLSWIDEFQKLITS